MLTFNEAVTLNGQAPTSPPAISSIPTVAVPTQTESEVKGTGKQTPGERHIWLVTGPAGCGKTTIAQYLATSLNLPYLEGDAYHPQANVDKMSKGIPLADGDRWDWLTQLREESLRLIDSGSEGVVLTCSALKRKYRDVIRVAPYFTANLQLHFIYLHAPEEVLQRRVAERPDHFMPPSLVTSQFSILQPPSEQEVDCVTVDVTRPVEEVQVTALEKVMGILKQGGQ